MSLRGGNRSRMRSLLALVALGMTLILSGCTVFGLGTTNGSGNLKTESRSVSGFTKVQLTGEGNLNITQTGTESLTISAEDNLLPLLTSDVSGGTLTLGVKPRQAIHPTKPITYTLTVKQLSGIQLSGAATITATNITTDALNVELSGLGQMTISGSAHSQTLRLSGSGNYSARGFQTTSAQVTISGAGNATVSASQTLDATISGAGNVTYYGSPQVTQSVSGIGSVKQGK